MELARTSHELGRLVREHRESLGWTQAELAHRAVVSERWVSVLERGHPNAQLAPVRAVLRALGLELAVTPIPPRDTTLEDIVAGYAS
ncbi:MAG: helix-turn-helix domain-containing protein [Propionibacteriaceae bacterium]|jgi:y4mF family transcriptional regulator|nr:helix-turn-helix domain-containing protein [Propionibacteriaceae bacterium]